MDQKYNELHEISGGRAVFYEYFTLAFNGTVDDNFLALTNDFAPFFVQMANESTDNNLKEGAPELTEFVKTMHTRDKLSHELKRAYTTLFYLGNTSIPAAESVYLSPNRLTKQQPWEDILRIYRKYGFGLPDEIIQTEEHVSAELLFEYYLIRLTLQALDSDQENQALSYIHEQHNFMKEHINKWIPDMCDNIIASKHEGVSFYKTIAKLLKGFLVYDACILRDILDGKWK